MNGNVIDMARRRASGDPADDPPADRRRSDAIAEELETMIVSGALLPGERLDETRLADRFAVSRTPLREALQRLAHSGLVEHRPRRGAFVLRPQPHEIVEMFEVMAELEALAGQLAARRASTTQLDGIAAAAAECERHADEPDSYYRANECFHLAIYDASGNVFLVGQARGLHRRLKPFRRLQLHARGRVRQSIAEHRAIVTALHAGDASGAAVRLRGHIAIQGERFGDLMATLRDHGAVVAPSIPETTSAGGART